MATEIVYGERTDAREYTVYVVEAMWPERGERHSRKEYGRYCTSAWNDRRKPKTTYDGYGKCDGTFDKENPDVAAHPSRITERMSYGDGLGGDFKSIPTFTEPGPALAYAARLAEVGELASKYDNMTHIPNWRRDHSGKVETRVVEERMARITRIVVKCADLVEG